MIYKLNTCVIFENRCDVFVRKDLFCVACSQARFADLPISQHGTVYELHVALVFNTLKAITL